MRRIVEASIIFIAVILLIFVFKTFANFIRPFVFAIILMFALMPLIKWSERKKIPFFITMFGIIIIVISLISITGIFIVLAIGEGSELADEIPKASKEIDDTAENLVFRFMGEEINLSSFIESKEVNNMLTVSVGSFLRSAGSFFTEFFLVIIFTIFLIPSRKHFLSIVHNSINSDQKTRFNKAMLQIENSIKDYLYTKTIISFGTAFFCGLVLLFFGSDYIIILSLMIFFFNYIPTIGSLIATGTALLIYAVTIGVGIKLLSVSILLIGIQQLFGSYLEPKFAGAKLKLNPILILLSLFLWSWIWGILGMLIAVPLTSIIKIILANTKSTKNIAEFMS